MITIYEIKPNGYIGISKEVDPSEGITSSWTYTPPPDIGTYRWESGTWVPGLEPVSLDMGVNEEQLSDDIRMERNNRLISTDWTQSRDISEEVSSKWASYRQRLRDLPSQEGFPFFIEWPEKP